MSVSRVPLVILAGGDPRPADMPPGAEQRHPLRGIKGHEIRLDGRPLIEHVVERFGVSPFFDPVVVCGPAELYGSTVGRAAVIDAAGHFGDNIRTGVDYARSCGPGPMAMTTSDILPEPADIERLVEDYRCHAPLDFWFPLAIVPEDPSRLGASIWKPRYRLRPARGQAASEVLPAHLVIADPDAVFLPLIYHSFELAYRTRNHSVLMRLVYITSHLLTWMVADDVRRLGRWSRPTTTVRTLCQAVVLALRLRSGRMSANGLAGRLDALFRDPGHRAQRHARRGRVALIDALSFAKDIDTLEEVDELGGRFTEAPPA